MAKYQIWYMRPEFFRDGSMDNLGVGRNLANLAETHIHLKTLELEGGTIEGVFYEMQGENWSPNGEARELILSKGLQHTSMSVGDVVIDEDNRINMVASFGFKELTGKYFRMNRERALPYVGHYVDDACCERNASNMPANARLIGWQCGFEPMFVAVWSYLTNVTLDDDEAIELATDLLVEKKWFAGEPTSPDYVI